MTPDAAGSWWMRRCGGLAAAGAGETRRSAGRLRLYPRLTAREITTSASSTASAATAREAARMVLQMLDMRAIADRRTGGFSHGERTKVAIARALVHAPRNVLLDEPTNGLDVMSTRAVRTIVRRLRASGHCVVFSSHVMQEVSALCDAIVVIARGQVVARGTPDELRRQTVTTTLEDAFVALRHRIDLGGVVRGDRVTRAFHQTFIVMRRS